MQWPCNIHILCRVFFFLCSMAPLNGMGQAVYKERPPVFYHLNRAQGLSDNYIHDMCTDRNGILWIATDGGLNRFNGSSVARFSKEACPALAQDELRQVLCDEKNRLWVLSAQGHATVIDEYRQFHAVRLVSNNTPLAVKKILLIPPLGLVLVTAKQHYQLKHQAAIAGLDTLSACAFEPIPLGNAAGLYNGEYLQYQNFGDDRLYLIGEQVTYIVDYKSSRVEKTLPLPHISILHKWNSRQLLCCDRMEKRLFLLDTESGARDYIFDKHTNQYGKPFRPLVNVALPLDENRFILTTVNDGVCILSKNASVIKNYRHSLNNPYSPASNGTRVIAADGKGWVFIGCSPNGISYFNSRAAIGQQTAFTDQSGNSYDGHINSIASYDDDTYYIGVTSTLIKWKRSTNETTFLGSHQPTRELMIDGVGHTRFDSRKRNWSAVPKMGVFIRDTNNRFLKHLYYEPGMRNSISSNYVTSMTEKNGYMWLCSRNGICRVNIATYETDTLRHLPFAELRYERCTEAWFSDSNTIWIGTVRRGVWRYNFEKKQLTKLTTGNGLTSNHVLCFGRDGNSNICIGTDKGLNVLLPDGRIKQFTRQNGLINDRVEALLPDKQGRMWMCNSEALSCLNISDSSIRIFDERYGLSVQGFRGYSRYRAGDDEQFWGSEKGLQFFYPDDLWKQQVNLQAIISRIESKTTYSDLALSRAFRLPAGDNYIHFFFSAVDYSQHLHTYYQYKLEGFDKDWVTVADQNTVRYNTLPPGTYTFRLRAGNDRHHWVDAQNTVTIIIAAYWWQAAWFKWARILLAALLLYMVIRYFMGKQKRKNQELETELVINYFASQINSLHKTGELLWDVARNLIGKLGFANCMIYLWNDDKTVLLQKAGYGTKGSMQAIANKEQYHIPRGKGIVGAAVESRQPLLVNDTSKDKRYFTADETVMLSELCVPLIHGNETLGAINIEHYQKNFFTAKHLQMLSTIAVLCANQVQRIRAEEEKQQATIELLENRRRAMEFRLQSLRLQMNPHFLFNALNSVQQMILANEEMVATRYLSRFSKLLRTILVHSESENISLREEIEILSLYAELESIRFKDSFRFTVECDENIDTEEITIPTLLVQPFVENAIWHGLMHKEGDRLLKITFTETGDFIRCTVEDNGVGRSRAAELKINQGRQNSHKSRGIELAAERLKTMKTKQGREGGITIIDKTGATGLPAGTIVQIDVPIQN